MVDKKISKSLKIGEEHNLVIALRDNHEQGSIA
jgi:hypothetical protein